MNLREEDSPKDATRTGCPVTAATIENAKDKNTTKKKLDELWSRYRISLAPNPLSLIEFCTNTLMLASDVQDGSHVL